jgi:dihydrofolate reductase
MRSVTYSMGVSLDGYIVGPDGGFDWTVPDEEVFRFVTDEIREVGVHLLGRRLYETMLYWETADQDPSLDDSMLEWAAIWKPLPKVVFSTTLPAVQGNARLASGGLAEEIERLRAEPAEGNIAIGGATLAAEAAELGLIGPRTHRDPHLQLESRLPPLPRGALAISRPAASRQRPGREHGAREEPHLAAINGHTAGLHPPRARARSAEKPYSPPS